MILAGDIGGTNTRLALFDGKKFVDLKKYSSQKYGSLEEIVKDFLQGRRVDRACFGVAGPVLDGKSKITNLIWTVDSQVISKMFSIRVVHVINDLIANACGIRVLKKEELFCLHPGIKKDGNQGLISAGTGLGIAGLFWDGKTHHPFPSEGGHAGFSPRDENELELFQFLHKKFGHVSCERAISGPGLHSIFDFLIESGKETFSSLVKKEMETKDGSRVISELGVSGKDRACVRAVDWFVSMYGSEAGNTALHFLTAGGLYIGGGIAPHLIEKMKSGSFYSAFINKGKMKGFLEQVPIWVILNEDTALLGAAHYE